MKPFAYLTLLAALLAGCTADTYRFELSGELSESEQDDVAAIDMVQVDCDPSSEEDYELYTAALFTLSVRPVLINEPGAQDVENDLYVRIANINITYTPAPRAQDDGFEGAAIAAVDIEEISQRELKVGTRTEVTFYFLTADQKLAWWEEMGADAYSTFVYDYTMEIEFELDGGGSQIESFTGTVELGNFDNCEN